MMGFGGWSGVHLRALVGLFMKDETHLTAQCPNRKVHSLNFTATFIIFVVCCKIHLKRGIAVIIFLTSDALM